uniref:Leucine zipper transcription factor-like protein 1 n=1 Tax=Latimeria chalumnae TaxID=7897 RepID=H2ZVT4_LATCH
RLVEETFTVDEVSEMLDGLKIVVHGEVESELINTAHTNVLLLRQLLAQAEKWYLKLQSDISELENRELLEQVAEFEKAEFISSSGKKANPESSKPKLAPLNEGGVSELLNKEIARLREENEKLKTRLKTIETQATSALDEKTKLERTLKELQKVQGDQKDFDFLRKCKMSHLPLCVCVSKKTFLSLLKDGAKNGLGKYSYLPSTKHEFVKKMERVFLVDNGVLELEKKFQQTAAYRNMKEILIQTPVSQLGLRKLLETYEPED